jgi:8-oxo-dGTP diphosphatase
MPENNNTLEVCAGLIWRGDQILIGQRAETKHQNRWEFPGGKIEANESPQEALQRELEEELAIQCEIGDHFLTTIHPLESKTLHLHTYQVLSFTGEAQALIHKKIRWIRVQELSQYDFLPADLAIIEKLQASNHVH